MNTSEMKTLLLNAFQPDQAIEHPGKFAGRRTEIRILAGDLKARGTCPMVFGERGLGKSSIAAQVARIGAGDAILLEKLDLSDYVLGETETYVTFYLACTDEIESTTQLLQRIINVAEGLYLSDNGRLLRTTEHRSENALKLSFFESKLIATYGDRDKYESLSVGEKLQKVIDYILRNYETRVLIIVDDLDRIKSTAGLANYINANSSEHWKFLLVGMADNFSDLIADHQYVDRVAIPVPVLPMGDDELAAIIRFVEDELRDHGVDILFDVEAQRHLVRYADGYPWFVHVLGEAAVRLAFERAVESREEPKWRVLDQDIVAARRALAHDRYVKHLDRDYRRAVGNAKEREIVLRCLARWQGETIPTSDVYRVARIAGVVKPSAPELTRSRFGAVLRVGRDRRTYTFRNALFKRFVNLRDSCFEGVRDTVEQVWEREFGADGAH
jgi:hypothetical protein